MESLCNNCGSFVASESDEYSSSDDSYQMTAPVNSPSSTIEDSTHIYMNILDQSYSLNKNDSVETESGSTDDLDSHLSYLLSTIQRSQCNDVLNVTCESCDSDLDMTLGPRPPCVGREDTQLEQTDVRLTTQPPPTSTSKSSATDPYSSLQSTSTRGRHSHTTQSHSDCQQLVHSINVNVHQWLHRLTSPALGSTNHCSSITEESSNCSQSCTFESSTDDIPTFSIRRSTLNVVDISPIKKRTSPEVVDSGVDSDYSDGSGSDSSSEYDLSLPDQGHHHDNQLPPDSVLDCSKTDNCDSQTTNCSIDSDTSIFTQQLFVSQPVTGNKMFVTKKTRILKCLKKFGKLLKAKQL